MKDPLRPTSAFFQRPGLRRWLMVSAVYLLVRGAADAGSHWLRLNDGFSLWYPPVGVDVAVLCMFGPWFAPAVAASQTISLVTSDFGATGWILVAYVGWHVMLFTGLVTLAITKLRMDPHLGALSDAVIFTGWMVLILPVLTAVGKVTLLIGAGRFSADSFGNQALALAVGDATGIAMTAPLLLLAGAAAPRLWWDRATKPLRSLRLPNNVREGVALVFHGLLTVAAVWFSVGSNQRSLDLSLVMALPVIWAALRYGLPGAVTSVFAVNITVALLIAPSVAGSALARDPFSLQLALFAISGSGILVGALVGQEREKRAEAETATRKLHGSFRSSPDPIVLTRLSDFALVEVNDAYTAVSGFTAEETIGRSAFDLGMITRDDEDRIRSGLASGLVRNVELDVRVADGRTLTMLWSAEQFEVDGDEYFISVVRDVTEQRRLEYDLLRASEREQRRLGRELHDHLGQTLTGISYLSQSLAQRTAELDADISGQHAIVGEQLGEAIRELRAIAHGLNPSVGAEDDLGAALDTLAEDVSVRFGVLCHFRNDVTVVAEDPEALTHVYRIAQEATTNAIRHGEATVIELSLDESSEVGKCTLTIEDNGTGFSEVAAKSGGLGIRNMQFRARQIGGSLKLEAVGQGTRVRCDFSAQVVLRSKAQTDVYRPIAR